MLGASTALAPSSTAGEPSGQGPPHHALAPSAAAGRCRRPAQAASHPRPSTAAWIRLRPVVETCRGPVARLPGPASAPRRVPRCRCLRLRFCLYRTSKAKDKIRGNLVFLPLCFVFLIFFNSFILVYLTEVQTRGKRMVRFKVTRAKS